MYYVVHTFLLNSYFKKYLKIFSQSNVDNDDYRNRKISSLLHS